MIIIKTKIYDYGSGGGGEGYRCRNGYHLYHGYAINSNGNPIKNTEEYIKNKNKRDILGSYLYIEICENNEVNIVTTKINISPIYYYEDNNIIAISSSPLISSTLLEERQLSTDFIRAILTYSVCFNNSSIFRKINKLMPNEEIRIRNEKLQIQDCRLDFLYDSHLQSLYTNNRKKYWNECFDLLTMYTGIINLFSGDIRFPLSGGKDSRLLLALILNSEAKNKITEIYTNGPDFSPEVLSAKNIANYYKLKYSNIDNSSSISESIYDGIYSKIYNHFFLTYAELSPMDLMFRYNISKSIYLSGQESGLRNIAGRNFFKDERELTSWMYRHLANGDMLNSLNFELVEKNRIEIQEFINKCINEGIDINQIPTLHRVMYRGSRWVSTLGKVLNVIQFSPFLFFNDVVVKYTYNAGSKSRTYEEFHYEMLKRSSYAMIEFPFSEQIWPKELESITGEKINQSIPYRWPEHIKFQQKRGINNLLSDRKEILLKYLNDNYQNNFISGILDIDKINTLLSNELLMGHYQPLWQLIQVLLVKQILDKDNLFRFDKNKKIAPIF